MIKGILGMPGAGKTLSMVEYIGYFLNRGRVVATNIELLPACPYYNYVVKIGTPEFPIFAHPKYEGEGRNRRQVCGHRAFWHYMPGDVDYVIDELDNHFDSMDFQRLNDAGEDVRLYFKQHEKHGLAGDNIIYTVQDLDNLWTRIRRMTQTWVVCENSWRSSPLMQKLPRSMTKFLRAEFADKNLRPESLVAEGYLTYKEASKMFGWYKRTQLIGDPAQYRWGGAA